MKEGSNKDWWEKTEIIAKVFGTTFVPIAVAAFFWNWNSERNYAAESAERIRLAIEILNSPSSRFTEDDELLLWAHGVVASLHDQEFPLQGPNGETALSIVCDAMRDPLIELATTATSEQPERTVGAVRNVVATMDAVCDFS